MQEQVACPIDLSVWLHAIRGATVARVAGIVVGVSLAELQCAEICYALDVLHAERERSADGDIYTTIFEPFATV